MYTYIKRDNEWCIRSDDANAAGQTVTVTKRSGAAKQVTLGAKIGEGEYHYYAIAAAPAREAETVGDLAGIIAMFDRARAHLKFPAVVLKGFRINVAGDSAREPGSLTITSAEKGYDGRRAWLGRVTKAGVYEPGRHATPAIGAELRRFAADPVGVAGEYGRLHGICCFCNRALTDERSTTVGYGPICADHFGLPWGAREIDDGEAEMMRMEVAADRAGTIRDERNKHAARAAMERIAMIRPRRSA